MADIEAVLVRVEATLFRAACSLEQQPDADTHQANECRSAAASVAALRAALARPAGDAGARVDEAHRALGKPGRVDDDGCCAGCGRSVQPSPCCPDYPVGSPETCPTCGVGEPWNRYSYKTTDGDGRPLIVYTDSAGDGDRDECADPWHDDDLADRVLAQVKDPASPLSKALWHATPTPPAPADDAKPVACWTCHGTGQVYDPRTGMQRMVGCPDCRAPHPALRPADGAGGAEAMRERAASLCDRMYSRCPMGDPWREASRMCAVAIRALPLPARADAVEDAASVERAAAKWVASEVDTYPGTTMDDRIASWMRGGVHPDDVSRFLVDAYVAGHRSALRAKGCA